MAHDQAALRMMSVTVGYQAALIRDIVLSLFPGERAGIIGPNGCGKSCILKTLAGTIAAQSGSIHLRERNATGWCAERRARDGRVSFLPQDARTFRGLTVAENWQLALWHAKIGRQERLHRLGELLEREPFRRLADRVDDLAGTLSGGLELLVGIGGCILSRPSVALLDEPSAGLDEAAKELLPEMLAGFGPQTAMVIVEQNIAVLHRAASAIWMVRVKETGGSLVRTEAAHGPSPTPCP